MVYNDTSRNANVWFVRRGMSVIVCRSQYLLYRVTRKNNFCHYFPSIRTCPFVSTVSSLILSPKTCGSVAMGANISALLSEEIDEISRQSNLSQVEVKRLYKRFQKLDRNQSGRLDADQLLMIPELAMSPLHPRLVAIFDNVNFREFVDYIGAFSGNVSAEKKIDFTFRVYDVDEDGYISCDDLEMILKMLVGDNIQEHVLRGLVEKVVQDADTDGDGRISRDEFNGAIDVADVARKLVVSI